MDELKELHNLKQFRKQAYVDFMGEAAIIHPDTLDCLGFFDAPASTKYHGAYDGGLFDHSLAVANALVELTEKLGLQWERPESPYIIGMFHDMCKCNAYVKTAEGKWTWNNDIIMPGHGEKSVMQLQKLVKLTDEEIICIRWHMGAFETDTKMWDYYGKAIEKYPNVLYTHTADMIASRIQGV